MSLSDWFQGIIMNDFHTVNSLLEKFKGSVDSQGDTGLMVATQAGLLGMVRRLAPYESGARSSSGCTALMIACMSNMPELVSVLLPLERDFRLADGRDALMLAASSNSGDVMDILMPNFSLCRDNNSLSALDYAGYEGHLFIVMKLVRYFHPSEGDISIARDLAMEAGRHTVVSYLDSLDTAEKAGNKSEVQSLFNDLDANSDANILISCDDTLHDSNQGAASKGSDGDRSGERPQPLDRSDRAEGADDDSGVEEELQRQISMLQSENKTLRLKLDAIAASTDKERLAAFEKMETEIAFYMGEVEMLQNTIQEKSLSDQTEADSDSIESLQQLIISLKTELDKAKEDLSISLESQSELTSLLLTKEEAEKNLALEMDHLKRELKATKSELSKAEIRLKQTSDRLRTYEGSPVASNSDPALVITRSLYGHDLREQLAAPLRNIIPTDLDLRFVKGTAAQFKAVPSELGHLISNFNILKKAYVTLLKDSDKQVYSPRRQPSAAAAASGTTSSTRNKSARARDSMDTLITSINTSIRRSGSRTAQLPRSASAQLIPPPQPYQGSVSVDIERAQSSLADNRHKATFSDLQIGRSLSSSIRNTKDDRVENDALTHELDNPENTPLMNAFIVGNLDGVLNMLSYVGKQRSDGTTALMLAAQFNRISAIKYVVKKEARMKRSNGSTALQIALEKGYYTIADLLTKYEGIDISRYNAEGGRKTELMVAAEEDNLVQLWCLRPLQERLQDQNGKTALMYALEKGNIHCVYLLLPCEAKIRDSRGNTIVHYCSKMGARVPETTRNEIMFMATRYCNEQYYAD